ncbi:MAG: hypothetical protein ACOYMQ_07945 [Pseudanabaena sp.]|jgi:hypothetical protein
MSKSLINKVIAIGAAHLIFNVTMFFTGNSVASAPAISQALKWLSFGTHEQYGVWTLISIAFMVNSFLKRIL